MLNYVGMPYTLKLRMTAEDAVADVMFLDYIGNSVVLTRTVVAVVAEAAVEKKAGGCRAERRDMKARRMEESVASSCMQSTAAVLSLEAAYFAAIDLGRQRHLHPIQQVDRSCTVG